MSDPDLRDVDVARLDFPGLADEANHAFKPHFADVEARARRIRRNRVVGATLVAVGVLAASGTATAAFRHDAAPAPATTPSPSIGPWTADFSGSSRTPAPQPSYTPIAPGAYDVTKPDVPLTGMWTELKAGDLDHLYLEYQDCKASRCVRMLAASADRGRTWRRLRMPEGLITDPKYTSIVAVHGTTVVARDSKDVRMRELNPEQRAKLWTEPDTYWVSSDGGATWRRPTLRTVDALPAGWSYLSEDGSLAAFDPATGDLARAPLPGRMRSEHPLDLPDAAGIWVITPESAPVPSPRPTTSFTLEGWLVAMVTRDGGRTWEKHRIPDAITRREGGGFGFSANQFATADGRTVYAIEKLKGRVRVYVSTDGAATWRTGAEVDLGGPLLSLLPTTEGALILESPTATWRSTDGGASFTQVGPSLGSRGYALPGGGYAIPTNNGEFSVWLSPDGAKWSYVGRPEVP